LSDSNDRSPAVGPNLDLTQLPSNHDLSVSMEPMEHGDDRAHRLRQDGYDKWLGRAKDDNLSKGGKWAP